MYLLGFTLLFSIFVDTAPFPTVFTSTTGTQPLLLCLYNGIRARVFICPASELYPPLHSHFCTSFQFSFPSYFKIPLRKMQKPLCFLSHKNRNAQPLEKERGGKQAASHYYQNQQAWLLLLLLGECCSPWRHDEWFGCCASAEGPGCQQKEQKQRCLAPDLNTFLQMLGSLIKIICINTIETSAHCITSSNQSPAAITAGILLSAMLSFKMENVSDG